MGAIIDLVYNLAMVLYYIIKAIVVPWIPIKYRSKDISGQIALVTGAGGGIGRLLAIGLSNAGCKVVCWDVAKQGKWLHNLRIFPSRGFKFYYSLNLKFNSE
jgi:all-trans-retinol dehydrogenase (NAD+)